MGESNEQANLLGSERRRDARLEIRKETVAVLAVRTALAAGNPSLIGPGRSATSKPTSFGSDGHR